ncbi:hypothetical protein F5Y03DRAFT_400357 [Xylaria venustula]|nr:hypothetical protein F5Y03DRAFT_400357 [Xylaria venustula]
MADYPSNFDPSQTPTGQPPAGIIPNFINPPSLSWTGRVAVYTTLPAMIVVLGLRAYTRVRIVRQFGIDDCDFRKFLGNSIDPMFTSTASKGLISRTDRVIVIDETYGRHLWDIPLSKTTPAYLQRLLATGVLYNLGAMFCKLALLTFYFRIFRPSQTGRIGCWCGIVLVVVFYVTSSVINLVYCLPRPLDGGWNSAASLARCDAHQQKLNFAQGIVSSVTDFYVLAIPLTMIASLKLSVRRKLGLLGVFLTGLTVAELNLGIICACLPILITLYKRFADTFKAAWRSFNTRMSSSTSKQDLKSAETASTSARVTGKLLGGTLIGLSSFMRNFGVSSTLPLEKSNNVDAITDNNTYVELRSIDYEYHAHIEVPSRQAKQP